MRDSAWIFATIAIISLACLGPTLGRFWQMPNGSLGPNPSAALRYGSVLFVNPQGQACRQSLIDNETWMMTESGDVDCDTAVAKLVNSERQKWSAGRVEAIRSGLIKR